MFGIAVGKLESQHPCCAPLAGKSTLNRLEQAKSPKDISSNDRYLLMAVKSPAIEQLLIDLFFDLFGKAPKSIFIMQALRQHCSSQTELATAQLDTIRTKLLKLGAQIRISVRRVLIAISSACPFQTVFATAYSKLQSLPNTS